MNQAPIILPAGGIGTLTGTNLCNAQTLDGPQVFLSTKQGIQPLSVLSAARDVLRYRYDAYGRLERVEAGDPGVGAGSIVVQTGLAQVAV